eukprot:scaffold12213_cov115-Isochrysis_galbana.AAC.12
MDVCRLRRSFRGKSAVTPIFRPSARWPATPRWTMTSALSTTRLSRARASEQAACCPQSPRARPPLSL